MSQTPPSSAKRPSKDKSDSNQAPERPDAAAQHIWLAGLGAMAKAQEQGSKAIEALINDGLALQRKSQAEAQQRMQEATERLTSLASDFGQPNAVRTDRLEHLFEDRVAKALHRLGIPSAGDLQSLNERLERLERLLTKPSVPPKVTPAVTPQTARQKPAARKSAPKPSNNTVPPDTSAPGPTRKARRPAGGSSSA
ncbi:hypothetical protein B9Z47_13685 [Limnohabitans sp. 2KL-1]|uniref:phasin family protein n=1 Tax=Limnohabitans sp. 2KL-1 TaxID=1100699 RepID=UPI000D34B63D|nr:phasin family protein [Limnohabitans sp. 2KL-1]PUE46399.1 hypothetical protein B9Z47_13685 [Limnohabitans sp. 2KL-1]